MLHSKLLKQIHDASAKFLAPLTPEETFQAIVEESIKLVDAKFGSILLEENGVLHRTYASDPILYGSIPLKRGYAFQCYTKQKAFSIGSKGLWKAHPELKPLGTRSVVFVPLVYAGVSIGVLTLHLPNERKVADEKLKILRVFGVIASSAIRKTQLYHEAWNAIQDRELHKSIENTLKTIYEASLKFLVATTPEDLYKTIVEEAKKLVSAEHASIFLADGTNLKRIYASSPLFFKVEPRPGGFVHSAFEGGRPTMILSEQLKDAQTAHPTLRKLAPGSIIFIPLTYRNTKVGILTVSSSEDKRFSGRERDVLALFGAFASLAIHNTQLYTQTKEAVQARDLFISMAAHELRTPLTAVNGYVQLLARKLIKADNQESKWAQELKWETARLTRLINDLLAVDSIKRGVLPYKFESVNLVDIVERGITEFKFSYPEHKISRLNRIKDRDALIMGDLNKLAQVLTNILNNAGKFTPVKKQIKVVLSEKDNDYKVAIRDQGCGIKKRELKKVFEGFHKGEKNYKEGMGLGLFIAKDIIKRHKGTVQVKSTYGEGTTFTITLPKPEHVA